MNFSILLAFSFGELIYLTMDMSSFPILFSSSCSMISHFTLCVEKLSVFHMIDLLGGGEYLLKWSLEKSHPFILRVSSSERKKN